MDYLMVIKQMITDGIISQEVAAKYVPELKESEDEKIRKVLIDYFDDANKADENPLQSYGVHTDKVIAWLEKQDQVKNDRRKWSEEDKGTLERIISFINSFVDKDLGEVVLNEEIFTDDAQQELKRYVDFLRNIENIKN